MIKCNELAARIHRAMCDDSGFGYTMGSTRWGTGGTGWLTITEQGRDYSVRRGDYDCSSSTITAWRRALEGSKYEGVLDSATYTGDMVSVFTRSGLFTYQPISFTATTGDLYISPGHHVAMCQTAVPDVLSEFSINEKGGAYGGQVGDQTGREAYVHAYYDYPWQGILHYNGLADWEPSPPKVYGYSAKLYQSNNTPMQQWRIEQTDGGWVKIRNVGRNMYLDVRDGSKADHTPVRVWEKSGGPAQLWKLIPVQGNYSLRYELEPKCAPGMRLDAIDGGTVNRTGLQIHPANRTAAQRWQFIDSGDGVYRIASSKSGLVIDAGAGVQP